jgi:hypothetical protein
MENKSKLRIMVAVYHPCILVQKSSYSDLYSPQLNVLSRIRGMRDE